MGVGKTTLSELLNKELKNSTTLYEQFEENQYIPLFYEEMKKNGPAAYNKYAFPSQMSFLSSGLKREEQCQGKNGVFIIDRCLYEDCFVFAQNAFNQGLLNESEFTEYHKNFEEARKSIQPFDLLIYLEASPTTIMERIQSRGREMEKDMSMEYIETLDKLYETNMFPAIEKTIKKENILVYDVEEIGEEELAAMCVKDIEERLSQIVEASN